MLKSISRNLVIILLVSIPVFGLISPHCPTEVDFDLAHAYNLDNKKLVHEFSASQTVLGQGSYGLVKELDWTTDEGKKIRVAVKQVIVKSAGIDVMLVEEINVLNNLRGVPKMLQMFGCMQTTQIVKSPRVVKGEKVTVDEIKTVMYIILEKLYASLEEAENGDDAPIKLLRGRELADRLKIYKSFAEALGLLHSKQLVHSDIKPANVMAVDKTVTDVKLIDFGFTDAIGRPFKGSSPLYKPNEGFMRSNLMPAFDTYAFGVSVAEIEVGYKAIEAKVRDHYKGSDKQMFVKQVILNIVKLLEENGLGLTTDANDNLTKIVADCIQFDAAARPIDEDIVKRIGDLITQLSVPESAAGHSDAVEGEHMEQSSQQMATEPANQPRSVIDLSKISLPEMYKSEPRVQSPDLRMSRFSPIRSDMIPPNNIADIIDAEIVAQLAEDNRETRKQPFLRNSVQNKEDVNFKSNKEIVDEKKHLENAKLNNAKPFTIAAKPEGLITINLDNGKNKFKTAAKLVENEDADEKDEENINQFDVEALANENKSHKLLRRDSDIDELNDIYIIGGGAAIALAVLTPFVVFYAKHYVSD